MKVIFLENNGKNKVGEIKDIAAGHAVNFLIPKGIALEATKENLHKLAQKKKNDLLAEEKMLTDLDALIQEIESKKIVISRKASPLRTVIGAVTKNDIMSEFYLQTGIKIDKKELRMEPIQYFGGYGIPLYLGHGKTVEINVYIATEN